MFRLKFRRAAAVSTAALFAAAMAIALPGAAQAAPAATAGPCWGPSCVGKLPQVGSNSQRDCVKGIANPYQGGYADAAYDVVTITTDEGNLTLRYSPLCAANWARWDSGQHDGDTYWVETADGNRSSTGDVYVLPNYTTMVDGTQLARVCWWDAVGQNGGCSTWN